MSKRVSPYNTSEFDKPLKKFQRLNANDTIDEEAKLDSGELERFIKDKKSINILKALGINSLFPIQYMTYKSIYSGEDLIAKDKTGSGKTLAFSLPII
jgi:ATP-dependent RNA helicase DDX21